MNRVCFALIVLMVVMAGFLPACSQSSDVIRVGANAKEASLSQTWDGVVRKTGLQDSTANLVQFSLWLAEDGTVELLYYMFSATDAKGKARFFSVNSEYDGDVTCYLGNPSTSTIGTIHPLGVFEELDKVPLTSVQNGHESLIYVSFTSGDIGYEDAAHSAPYLLKDGQLVPLKEVLFHTSTRWTEIRFSWLQQGSTPVQFWFLTSELEKAESVKYV